MTDVTLVSHPNSGRLMSTTHRLDDNVSLVFEHDDDGSVRETFKYRVRQAGWARNRLSEATLSNTDYGQDALAATVLTADHRTAADAIVAAYEAHNRRPVSEWSKPGE